MAGTNWRYEQKKNALLVDSGRLEGKKRATKRSRAILATRLPTDRLVNIMAVLGDTLQITSPAVDPREMAIDQLSRLSFEEEYKAHS